MHQKLKPRTRRGLIFGAEGRNRTADTRIFSPLLYRLSYLGILWCCASLCEGGGAEEVCRRSRRGGTLPTELPRHCSDPSIYARWHPMSRFSGGAGSGIQGPRSKVRGAAPVIPTYLFPVPLQSFRGCRKSRPVRRSLGEGGSPCETIFLPRAHAPTPPRCSPHLPLVLHDPLVYFD